MRVVQQAHLPCLVPESAAAIDIILSVGTGRAVLCCQSPIQSRNFGSCRTKQQCGRFDTAWHGITWQDEMFAIMQTSSSVDCCSSVPVWFRSLRHWCHLRFVCSLCGCLNLT